MNSKEVKDFRLSKGWSLDKMTEMSGVSKNCWLKLEHGEEVRPLTLRKMEDFLAENGFSQAERFCVIYQQNYRSTVTDETWFDNLGKAKMFADAQCRQIRPQDRENGAICIVSTDYYPESGDLGKVQYDAIAERVKWERELERDREEYESQA